MEDYKLLIKPNRSYYLTTKHRITQEKESRRIIVTNDIDLVIDALSKTIFSISDFLDELDENVDAFIIPIH